MAQRVFQQTYHVPGTLSANLAITFTAPMDMQLIHVSAVGSNANNGILTIGNSVTAAAYLNAKDIGDSHVPAQLDQDDFVGGEFPHIPNGTIVKIALDYDGASGTATNDFTLVLTFTEG